MNDPNLDPNLFGFVNDLRTPPPRPPRWFVAGLLLALGTIVALVVYSFTRGT